jgi:predicted peroxiredoxin
MKRLNGSSAGICGLAAILVLGGVVIGSLAIAPRAESSQAEEAAGAGQKIVVHLKHWTDDLHAVFMAVKLAGAMQAKGAAVTLFVNLEGARLADANQPGDMLWGTGGHPLSEYYAAFVEAGGKVLICPHCAMAAGIKADSLRHGARIAADDEVVDALLAADKILDY